VNERARLSPASKLTVAALLVSAAGVVIQMISGFEYPTIPPVFFILLIPAALIAFGPWRWTPSIAVVASAFLTFGLFASGSSARLFNWSLIGGPGGSIGLWIQMLAVIVAGLAGIIATIQSYRSRAPAGVGATGRG
jgi:hypothetical protein